MSRHHLRGLVAKHQTNGHAPGTNSHYATSTALVVDSDLSPEDVDEAFRSSLEAGGWLDPAFCTATMARDMVRELVDDMQRVALHFSCEA